MPPDRLESRAKALSMKNEETPRNVGLAERLLAIGKDCVAHLKEPFRSTEHGDLL